MHRFSQASSLTNAHSDIAFHSTFHCLQVGAAASLDRPSRRAFAKALSKCVVDMRGAVNVR